MRKPFSICAAALTATLLLPVSLAARQRPATAPERKVFEVTARKFAFEPSRIDVVEGDHVRLVVRSADGVHGVAIKKFRVSKLVPRGGEQVTIDFVASAAGTFPILCSEFCGDGHEDMTGTLVVRAKSHSK
jgi:cytochrome c oxidase subunit 2